MLCLFYSFIAAREIGVYNTGSVCIQIIREYEYMVLKLIDEMCFEQIRTEVLRKRFTFHLDETRGVLAVRLIKYLKKPDTV